MGDTYSIKKPKGKGTMIGVIVVIVIILVIIIVSSGVYSIDATERGILLRFGRVIDGNVQPGLHVKVPFVDEILTVSVKNEKEEFGFKTRKAKKGKTDYYPKEDYEIESRMLTGDLNIADVEWVVQYKIADPFNYVFKIEDAVKTMRDLSESIMRRYIGNMDLLKEIITTEKANATDILQDKMKKELQFLLDELNSGIQITEVYVQDLKHAYEDDVKQAFTNVISAEQEAKQLIENAEQERKSKVQKIDGDYRKMIEEAEGYKAERINDAKGGIAKFVALYEQYKLYPEITKKRMYIETITKLYTKLRKITIIDADVIKNTLPLLNLKGGN